MYIDPFWAGVLSTVIAELIAIFTWALLIAKKY